MLEITVFPLTTRKKSVFKIKWPIGGEKDATEISGMLHLPVSS